MEQQELKGAQYNIDRKHRYTSKLVAMATGGHIGIQTGKKIGTKTLFVVLMVVVIVVGIQRENNELSNHKHITSST